ncbi:hypothetical protein LX36DRAFT_754689, partial [Colletotrichum falcatum]
CGSRNPSLKARPSKPCLSSQFEREPSPAPQTPKYSRNTSFGGRVKRGGHIGLSNSRP